MRKPTSPRQADQAFRKDLIETIDSGSFSGAGACTAAPMLPPSLPMPASAGLSLSLSLSLAARSPKPAARQGISAQLAEASLLGRLPLPRASPARPPM